MLLALAGGRGGLAAELQGIDRGPGYATTTWATLHGDSSNSDSVPLVTSTDLEFQWRALEGAGIVVAPVVAPDGTLWVTTGRGRGYAHLHALSPTGAIQWESPPQRSAADLDSGAVLSAPVIGHDGNVYVGDSNQFFALRADGALWWTAELADFGAQGPFVTGIIVGSRVGGITAHGQVVLFERATGELAAPVLELPGGASPVQAVPDFVWQEGLIDADIRQTVFEVLLGYRFEVTNTPAVHPQTQRIYLMAAGRTTEEGAFYGIDLVEGGPAGAGARLEIAFETRTAPGSGTSPAISPDGSRVYASGGGGELIAFDATSGEVVFEWSVGGSQASPTLGLDGAVYILADAFLKKLDSVTGEVSWSRNYDDFARANLPEVSSWRPWVKSGKPVARLDSVATVSPNAVWTTLLCGYEISIGGRELVQAQRTWLVAIDPVGGDLLASYPIPDTSEGAISVGRGGEIYLDLLAVQASISAAAPYLWMLPSAMRTEPPRGGLVAFRPRSQEAQIRLGIGWAGDLLARGPVRGAADRLRSVRAQLEAAKWLGLGVDSERSEEIWSTIDGALEAVARCQAGARGEAGCAALADHSRELRLLRSALQRDGSD